jgi:hypothetical protein
MDERLVAIRAQVEASGTPSASLLALTGIVTEADRNDDSDTLKQSLGLLRRVAPSTGGDLRAEVERLIRVCEQKLRGQRPIWWDE